jgi:hypothetical protein
MAGIIAGSPPIKRSSRRGNALVADSDGIASVGPEGTGIDFPGLRFIILHMIKETACQAGRLDAARAQQDVARAASAVSPAAGALRGRLTGRQRSVSGSGPAAGKLLDLRGCFRQRFPAADRYAQEVCGQRGGRPVYRVGHHPGQVQHRFLAGILRVKAELGA